jgi:acyl-CoA synthetase (NDP forming)
MTLAPTRRGMEALLRPRSLAFVGVSAKGGAGTRMLHASQKIGFAGPLWPVHPKLAEIGGVPCFASLAALPATPDCVVVSLPAASVLGVLEEAAAKAIPSALVVSEGFADAGNDEGRARQQQLVDFAARSGMAIAGPNCMGLTSLKHGSSATMADIPRRLAAGGISLVSQSGGLMNAVAELAANRGVGFNYLVSIGNQAVVELADYIDFMADDSATDVIAVIMEGARNGRRFRAAIERAARIKPVVVLKLGRSEKGQAATLAHTGTLAGRHEAFAALFRQAGVALVRSLDELVETAQLLALAPLPKGDGVCMLTVSGGATSLISDLGEEAGLHFPPLGADTNRALQQILEVDRQFGNPVDTVGLPRLRKDDNLARILAALQADPAIDVIGLVLGMRKDGLESHEALIQELGKAAATSAKPLLVVSFISNSLTGHWRDHAARHHLPLLEDLAQGMIAIRHLTAYAKARRAAGNRLPPPAKREFDGPAGRTLTEADSKKILAQAGLPVTREFLARTPQEAAQLFAKIGGAAALKIQSAGIPHKSDIGGVVLNVLSAPDAEAAAARILANAARHCPDAAIDGVLVQEMVGQGSEFLLGMTYDEQFGPLIVCGAGGVTVELFKDASVRLPPLDADEARAMIGELKAAKLLEGFRGAPPGDLDALVDCLVRFAAFAAASDGQFAAIDLNPVIVRPKGEGARIADALMVTRGPD